MGRISNYFEMVWVRINLSVPVVGIVCGIPVSVALLLVSALTPLWPITLAYLVWIYTFDRNTSTTGGRKNLSLRKYICLPQHTKYMPLVYERELDTVLDQHKNYLFCCFPHSHTPYGIGAALATSNTPFDEWFPDHTQRIATLPIFFNIPFYREFLLANGLVSTSEQSLSYLLGDPDGGNIVGLVIGGSAEVQYATQKDYHIVVKNRRGFVRVALKNGASVVPVFSFGAENVYSQVTIPILDSCINWLKSKTGVLIFIYNGQGYFQKWFGLAPRFKPIFTIVGEPIDVEKTTNPTDEQIEQLHQEFIDSVVALFNKHKHKYSSDPDNTKLIIH